MRTHAIVNIASRELVLKQVGNTCVCNFQAAENRNTGKKDAKGNPVRATSFWSCAVWGDSAEAFVRNASVGRRMLLEGDIEIESYTSNKYSDGAGKFAEFKEAKVRVTSFQFLDANPSKAAAQQELPETEQGAAERTSDDGRVNDDDMPL